MVQKFYLILAKTENHGIGYKGVLPWKLKKELGYFQRMTKTVEDPSKQNAVIMGRLTWESMPDGFKPLSNRVNIVLSSHAMNLSNAIHCQNFDEVIEKLKGKELSGKVETAWIIGGARIYEQAVELGLCDRIYVTNIMKDYPCDTFVNLDFSKNFKETIDPRVPVGIQEEGGTKYEFKVYEKIRLVFCLLSDNSINRKFCLQRWQFFDMLWSQVVLH